jgi:hypothetical protein
VPKYLYNRVLQELGVTSYPLYITSSGALASPLHYTAERLLKASSSDENFCFSDWLNFSNSDVSPFQPKEFDSIRSPHTTWPSLQKIHTPPDSGPCHVDFNSPFETPDTGQGRDDTILEQPQVLLESVVFKQAISFLICEASHLY